MATGFTQLIIDNPDMTLDKWAFHCARAFGVSISMRDEDARVPAPKKFKPDVSYHKNRIKQEQAIIRKLEKMSEKQRAAYTATRREEVRKEHEKWLEEQRKEQAALDSMKTQLADWNPPAEYAEFKRFMGNQLENSSTYISYYEAQLARIDGTDYWKEDLKSARHSIERHEEDIVKEIQKTENNNKWLKGLYDSFKQKK